jgi:hypothetical protein
MAVSPTLPTLFSGPSLRLTSDLPLTPVQTGSLATEVERAFQFDLDAQQFDDDDASRGQMEVRFLSEAQFRQTFRTLTGLDAEDTLAFVPDAQTIIVRESVLQQPAPVVNELLAHELVHLQDRRHGWQARREIPEYFFEGKAYLMGFLYSLHLGEPNEGIELSRDFVTDLLDGPWAKEALTAGTDYRIGTVFLEYLRVHHAPDLMKRLGEIMDEVGEGKTYDDAFTEQLGMTPTEAIAAFVRFLDATQGQGAQRVAGTLWEVSHANAA